MDAVPAPKSIEKPVLAKGIKILLAEDNDINASIIQDMLSTQKAMVVRVADGELALQAVQQHDFDIVLMDCQMPNMDGYVATKYIRQLESEKSNIPIVAITANAYAEDRQLYLDAGMNEHISKPVDKTALISVLFSLVDSRANGSNLSHYKK